MPVDNFGQYTMGQGRSLYERGEITPPIEYSDSVRPALPLAPAPYLPNARFDQHKRANVVMSAGIPVALDGRGAMVPAGTPVGHCFTYGALDYAVGCPAVKAAADGNAVTAGSALSSGVMHSGLYGGAARLGDFMNPIGVTSYLAYQYEGGVLGTWPNYVQDYSNPVNFPIHNTQAQPETLVAVTCDYVLKVPYIYGKNLLSDTVRMFPEMDPLSAHAKSFPFAHDELIVNSGTLAGVNVVFVSPKCGTGNDGATGSLKISGATAGAMTLTVAPGVTAGATVDLSTTGVKVMYDGTDPAKYVVLNVTTALSAGANVTFTTKVADPILPGDYVACRLGRFVKWDPTHMDQGDLFGQALKVFASEVDRDMLGRVKTAYEHAVNAYERMAGSATRGVPSLHNKVTDAAQVCFETKRANLSQAPGTLTSVTGTSLPIGSLVINMLR
jgi:hypothetical protein